MAVLPRVRERLEVALGTLGRLYPQAQFPPVTIAVGRGKPVGVGSPATGIQIGLEALCATEYLNPNVEDRFVYVIAHEYAHVQQVQALADAEHPTVLQLSLLEGAAEFAAELISGHVAYSYFKAATQGRENEIETAFVLDVDKTDLSSWLNNGTPEKPGDKEMIEIADALDPTGIEAARQLFREYQEGLGIDLSFQDFASELETLPGAYTPPAGRLLLARDGTQVMGCVALRALTDDTCELKRLRRAYGVREVPRSPARHASRNACMNLSWFQARRRSRHAGEQPITDLGANGLA